jgi:signal transduction histidine kinase/DNA-binding response OmpR family regulator
MAEDLTQPERVLVLMPSQRDAERTVHLLAEACVPCAVCADLAELCRELRVGAEAVLLTDEILLGDVDGMLEDALRGQPAWSALPILVLAREGVGDRMHQGSAEAHKSMVLVERPVRTRTLVSVVRSALRARRNQYQIREAILERERQAQELLAQDEKLRFSLAAGKLGSWELELETELLTCSDICKASHGRAAYLPFTYQDLHDAIHPDDRARMRAAVAESIATGAPYDVEYRVFWPGEELHWVMARGRALYDAQRKPVRMVGICLDVTERVRLVEALQKSESELAQQAEQLRATDRLKDEFLATLAHELRNPLAPISTGLTLLTESVPPQGSQKTLAVMERQVNHMVRLIDDLLDVSRITMGKLELKRERIGLAGVVDAAVEGSLPAVTRGQHTLRVELAEEPLFLDADHTRIAQVISNLINNASKYTPAGGTIVLSTRRDGEQVVIAVQDNGLGIPQERLDDVFRMFSQVNRALERSQGGLGIGLALVRRLVEMHGGTVTAHSDGIGLGSTFTVRLPLAQGPSMDARQPAADITLMGDQRVLVVDDNDDAAELLSLMLEKAGYQTATAHDGYAALEACTSWPRTWSSSTLAYRA